MYFMFYNTELFKFWFFLHFRVAEYIPPRPLFPKRTDGAQRVSKSSEIHVQLQTHIILTIQYLDMTLLYIGHSDYVLAQCTYAYFCMISMLFTVTVEILNILLNVICSLFSVTEEILNILLNVICSLSIHVDFV